MTEIKWGAPEDRRRRANPDFRPIAQSLMEKPGEWGQIAEGLNESRTQASSLALGVRRGKYAAFKPVGAWEARSSKDKVWARFIGENGEHEQPEQLPEEEPKTEIS